MGLPDGLIEGAFMARYRGDSTLQGLLGNPADPPGQIFDASAVTTLTSFGYVVVYPIATTIGTALSMGQDAKDTYVQVSIYTQTAGGGMKQARDIAAQIDELTNGKALDLSGSGFTNFFLLFDNKQERPQNDGLTQSIDLRYKLMTVG